MKKGFFIAKTRKIKKVEEDKRDEKEEMLKRMLKRKLEDKRIDTEGKMLAECLKLWKWKIL